MDYKKIWKKAKGELRASLPEHAYKAWIETLVPVGLTNNVFILEAPNRFAYEWINNNYYVSKNSFMATYSLVWTVIHICLI